MADSRRRWPRRDWDPESFEIVCRVNGTSPEEVERECRLKEGRLEDLAESGWNPFIWEFARMADVLGMSMDDLYDEAFPEPGR